MSLDDHPAQRSVVSEACEREGRDPATMTWSGALVACVGEDDAEFERRAAAIGREPDELRTNGAAGTVAEVADTIGRWAEAGVDRLCLQVLDLSDLDHLDTIAAVVAD